MRHYYFGALMICVSVIPTGVAPLTTVSIKTVSAYPLLSVVPCGSPGAYVLMTEDDVTGKNLDIYGITPESVTQVFGWGLAAVLLIWSIGYAVAAGIAVIRKL